MLAKQTLQYIYSTFNKDFNYPNLEESKCEGIINTLMKMRMETGEPTSIDRVDQLVQEALG